MSRRYSASEEHAGFSFGPVLHGLIVTIVITLVVSLAMSLIIYATAITEGSAATAIYFMGIGSVAIGGACGARRSKGLGWLHGGTVGLIYAVLSLGLSFVIMPGCLILAEAARRVAVAFLVGALGGVVGVNM